MLFSVAIGAPDALPAAFLSVGNQAEMGTAVEVGEATISDEVDLAQVVAWYCKASAKTLREL
jgi:hypothetical protein